MKKLNLTPLNKEEKSFANGVGSAFSRMQELFYDRINTRKDEVYTKGITPHHSIPFYAPTISLTLKRTMKHLAKKGESLKYWIS